MELTRIKRRILIPISLLILTSTVAAQPGQRRQGPPPMPNKAQIAKMVDELEEELDLTRAQKATVSSIYYAHFEEVEEIMESGKVSRETMDTLRKEFESQVEAVLSKSQVRTYQKLQIDQRPPQSGRRR